MSTKILISAVRQMRHSAHKLDVLRSTPNNTETTLRQALLWFPVRRSLHTSFPVGTSDGDTGVRRCSTQLDALAESLASKGYLRAQKPYTPAADMRAQIDALLVDRGLNADVALSAADKFAVLNACFAAFAHSVPNSQLHEVNTIDDIVRFYETPVNTQLPLDAMHTMELPDNLHIQHEYVRFTGDESDAFRGQTAFPRSSTLVTGLKYRHKYAGNTAKRSWP